MRVPILGASYAGRSTIASGQLAVNVYAESNKDDPQAPTPITWYPTPGSVLYSNPNNIRSTRCTYRTSKGTAYVVVGPVVYFLSSNQTLNIVGFIADRLSQVYMADNGSVVVLVDGISGYVIDMASNDFGQIVDPAFYGADFVAFLDTFFIFNRPGTNQFYISASIANFGMLTSTAIATGTISAAGAAYTNGTYNNIALTGGSGTGATANITVAGNAVTVVTLVEAGMNYLVSDVLSALAANIGGTGAGFTYTVQTTASAFDPLDIAAKSGSADPIVAILAIHRELWLIGDLTAEIWIGTGAADFYFQQQQGAFIEQGSAAPYSATNIDVTLFYISQNKAGNLIVVKGVGYDVEEISTPRLIKEFKNYPTISDAIGFCFQIEDHAFYCLVFPTANKTWLYELKTGWWNEWAWTDENGILNRHRANCAMFAYGENLIGDWENGKLLSLKQNVGTDEGSLIRRIKTFPHIMKNGDRVYYDEFVADVTVGELDDEQDVDEPKISLSWSDDRGKTYGNPVEQTLGAYGEFLTQPSWNRLGSARDRVFKLEWSTRMNLALNGAFIDFTPEVGQILQKQ